MLGHRLEASFWCQLGLLGRPLARTSLSVGPWNGSPSADGALIKQQTLSAEGSLLATRGTRQGRNPFFSYQQADPRTGIIFHIDTTTLQTIRLVSNDRWALRPAPCLRKGQIRPRFTVPFCSEQTPSRLLRSSKVGRRLGPQGRPECRWMFNRPRPTANSCASNARAVCKSSSVVRRVSARYAHQSFSVALVNI